MTPDGTECPVAAAAEWTNADLQAAWLRRAGAELSDLRCRLCRGADRDRHSDADSRRGEDAPGGRAASCSWAAGSTTRPCEPMRGRSRSDPAADHVAVMDRRAVAERTEVPGRTGRVGVRRDLAGLARSCRSFCSLSTRALHGGPACLPGRAVFIWGDTQLSGLSYSGQRCPPRFLQNLAVIPRKTNWHAAC